MSAHLELDDATIDEAFEKEWISDWDFQFLTNLINYSELTEKQDTKFRAILRKIERGQKRSGKPVAIKVCRHCGHELN